MNRVILSFAVACFAVALHATPAFSINDSGRLSVKVDGKTILDSGTLTVNRADGSAAGDPLKESPLQTVEGGRYITTWAGEYGVVCRELEKMSDGRVKLRWEVKLLDSIPGGKTVLLAYRLPASVVLCDEAGRPVTETPDGMIIKTAAGDLTLKFSGVKTKWRLEDMRKVEAHKHYRLSLEWEYNPADVNVVDAVVFIGKAVGNQ